MPAQPDRDTLHLRAPDRRTPAEAAALVRRVLARPPAASFADVGLAPPDRALVSLHGRYPGVEAHYPEPVRWAAAHGPAPQPRGRVRKPCAWCMALVRARHRGQPPPGSTPTAGSCWATPARPALRS